jgi:TolA-binding protein
VNRIDDPEIRELLDRVGDPPPLGSVRTERILKRIQSQKAPARIAWWWLAMPAAAFCLALVVVRPKPPEIEAAKIQVLSGRVDASGDRISLADGSVRVQTAASAATIESPAGHVLIRAGSIVEVHIRQSEVRVAAYRGSARIEWRDFGSREVPEGQTVSNQAAPSQAPPPVQPVSAPAAPTIAMPVEKRKRVAMPILPDEPPDEPIHTQPTTQAPAARAPSALAQETASLERAVKALRHDHDAATALRAIDDHLHTFPNGQLHSEAELTRVEALLHLGRKSEALVTLEKIPLQHAPRELTVIRGELRAEAGRCKEAVRDFASAVDGSDELAERALVGRADCRSRSGDDAGARADLNHYLERFPDGRFVARAKSALDGL